MNGVANRGATIAFGSYGLKTLEAGKITSRQIEAARVAITRKVKRGGKLWIRIFPDFAFTKKPAETRMGKGKGNPEGFIARVYPGRVLFEIDGVDEDLARKAFESAMNKLPVKCKFISINQ
jgi:large subunit ribosomal protein L16